MWSLSPAEYRSVLPNTGHYFSQLEEVLLSSWRVESRTKFAAAYPLNRLTI